MSKYIDQERLLSRMLTKSKLSIDGSENYVTQYGFSKEDIESECVVDEVEVVRCKDCKYADYDNAEHTAIVCLRDHTGWNKPDDYCSYGEREE